MQCAFFYNNGKRCEETTRPISHKEETLVNTTDPNSKKNDCYFQAFHAPDEYAEYCNYHNMVLEGRISPAHLSLMQEKDRITHIKNKEAFEKEINAKKCQ